MASKTRASDQHYVLVVEDDADIRASICEFLDSEGYLVQAVENGQRALELLKRTPLPKLILLDLFMPVMNGQDFLKIKIQTPGLSEIPVLVLTASKIAIKSLLQSGLDQTKLKIISKPVSLDELLEAVSQYY